MKLGYTEFSYGYAFTDNLIRSAPATPLSAPVFPNLIQEAQSGFDVRIDLPGLPLFFQYKLPELMLRNSAFEISKHNLARISVPFFRVKLMRRDLSDQHSLLIELEKKYPRTVLYASPMLESGQAFNQAYSTASVHQRSVFFSPGDIGPLPDDGEHSVAYRDGLAFAYLCSEPKRISTRTYEALSRDMGVLFRDSRFSTLRNVSAELRNSVRSLASNAMRQAESLVEERISQRRSAAVDQPAIPRDREQVVMDILVAREMSRIDFGLDILIAQPST